MINFLKRIWGSKDFVPPYLTDDFEEKVEAEIKKLRQDALRASQLDVSTFSLSERKENFRDQYGAYDVPPGQRRLDLCEIADEMARDEMLQEIHTMLLHLTGVSK